MAMTTRARTGAADADEVKMTVLVPRSLHRAVRVLAAEQERTIKEVVIAALQAWALKCEEEEDLRAADAAGDDPYVAWEDVKAEMRAARAERGEAAPDEE